MAPLRERLEQYLSAQGIDSPIEPITPDASTREYFRFRKGSQPVVACVYPDAIKHAARSYLDVTELFRNNDLQVAEVYDFDEVLGVVVIEDLGDSIMRAELETTSGAQKDELISRAIDLIPQIQRATGAAAESNSIASRLRFDVEKLMWELNYFKIHYFTTFKKEPLSPKVDKELDEEFMELSAELDSTATVLCHRDFHAANLMIDSRGDLRIIDHQDARIGAPAYDLVSLLLDRVVETPSDKWITEMQSHFHKGRESCGLESLDRDKFEREFQLQTVQRCLKAAGTFSFQSASRNKTYFISYINPMFRISLRAMQRLDRFPHLQKMIAAQL